MRARSIVVDASIARATGERSLVALACARVLDGFRSSGHAFVTSPRIRAEWKKHASNLATAWLVDMVSRGRFVDVGDREAAIDDDDLAAAAASNDAALDAMRKDYSWSRQRSPPTAASCPSTTRHAAPLVALRHPSKR